MTLPQLRGQLVAALQAAGVVAVDGLPARVSPPVALVAPGTPYVAGSDTFGTRRAVRLRVRLVVPNADSALDELDELIERALPAIESIGDDDDGELIRDGDSWSVLEAGEPYTLVVGTTAFPAVDLDVTTSARFD